MSFKGWTAHKVGDFCETISKTHKFQNGKVVFLNTGDIEKGKFLHKKYSLTEGLPGQAKKSIQKGDILLSEIRPANGRYAFVEFDANDYVVSTKLMVIRAKENISPRYLYHFLTNAETTKTLQHLAESRSGTFPQITFTQVQDLEILVPDLKTQKQIASFIDSVDDTINNNQQTNKTLEEMAKAIFKEWFVNFNFPNATGKFQETEVGKIPVGWKVGKLADEFNITMGQSPPGDSYNEEKIGTPFFQGRTDFEFRFPSNRIYTTLPKRFSKKLDTLVSVRAPVGDMNIASEDCCIGRGLAAVIHKRGNPSFTYYFLNSLVEKFKMFEGTGTVFGSINKTDFENMVCIYPTIELINDFEKVCRSIDEQILNNEKENQSLTNLRVTLLPKLMKGEISIYS